MRPEESKPTSVELFAGASGLGLGCAFASLRSLATVDVDRWAFSTLKNEAVGFLQPSLTRASTKQGGGHATHKETL